METAQSMAAVGFLDQPVHKGQIAKTHHGTQVRDRTTVQVLLTQSDVLRLGWAGP